MAGQNLLKEAWVNPQGGHLGREAVGWRDPEIFDKVLLPWIVRTANAKGYGSM